MAKGDKQTNASTRITEKQRYRYIGFEVFPGKPKELFKNDAERQQLISKVQARRESDSTLRDDCILLEERISFGEKLILAVASLAILVALVLPWYSAYMVVPLEAEEPVAATEPLTDSAMLAMAAADTLGGIVDSMAAAGVVAPENTTEVAGELTGEEIAAKQALVAAQEEAAAQAADESRVQSHQGERANEQIITAHAARARTTKVYSYLSGVGVFAALGTVGADVFSSGFILVISGVLMLLYALLCIALPVLNLYVLFGLKGKPDEVALKLKKYLKLNWLPLILFVVVLALSFVGADYGFDTTESFTSLGDAYSVAALLGTLSWGVFLSMAASILVAVKGIEI